MSPRRLIAMFAACMLVMLALPARAADHRISMREGGSPSQWYFTPVNLIIRVGESVEWQNDSTIAHTVTAYFRNGSREFDSSPGTPDEGPCATGPLEQSDCKQPGETFEWTFESAGTFSYFCKAHRLPPNESVKPDPSKGAQSQPCQMCGIVDVRAPQSKPPVTKSTPPSQTGGTRKPTTTGSPRPTGSVTPTGTPTTDGSGVAAPGSGDGGSGGKTALALLSILALGGAGYATWRRFLAGS